MVTSMRRTINKHTEEPQPDWSLHGWTTREHYSRLTKQIKGKKILEAMISNCIVETQNFTMSLNAKECKVECDALKKVSKSTKEIDKTPPEEREKIEELEKTLNDNLMDL